MEDFVTFEIAKKLKEKGFRKPCILYYNSDKVRTWFNEPDIAKNFMPITLGNDDVLAPTISQVLKWLRNEKDIDLVISPVFFYDGVLGKMREYGCKVFAPSLNKPEHCGYHEEWEQAVIAGIEYVLYKLI